MKFEIAPDHWSDMSRVDLRGITPESFDPHAGGGMGGPSVIEAHVTIPTASNREFSVVNRIVFSHSIHGTTPREFYVATQILDTNQRVEAAVQIASLIHPAVAGAFLDAEMATTLETEVEVEVPHNQFARWEEIYKAWDAYTNRFNAVVKNYDIA